MQDGNYIKINRSILDWEWYKNINTKVLFIHMLLKANWKDGKFEGKVIPRGSFVSSIRNLSEETTLTEREIRTAISHLKTTGEVTSKGHNKYSVFTVVNYNSYQTNDTQNDKQETNKRQTNDKLTTTIEEGKKERKEEGKKEKEVSKDTKKKIFFPSDELLDQAFADYVDMRKQLKKPMTDKAIELAIKKLATLSTLPFSNGMDNELAIQILNQSVLNSWQGLFPLSGDKSEKQKGNSIDWNKV